MSELLKALRGVNANSSGGTSGAARSSSGGSGGRRRRKARASAGLADALAKRTSDRRGVSSSVEAAATASGGDIPEITRMALDGNMGANQATQVYTRLMKSPTLNDTEKKKIQDYYEKGEGDPGGSKGLLGHLTDNPLTNAVGTALGVIDVGRRGVIATIDEGIEAIRGEGDDDSWLDKVRGDVDNYGFGQVVDRHVGSTGNQWADRAIGFTGDVLLDPLTYLTAGAATVPAQGARAAAGGTARAATKGAARRGSRVTNVQAATRAAEASRVAGKLPDGRLEGVAQRLRQRGTTAASEAELAEQGLRGGLRFMGKEVVDHDSYRKIMGPLAQPVRRGAANTAGRFGRRYFGDDTLRAARTIAADPKSSAHDVSTALLTVRGLQEARRGAGAVGGQFARQLTELQDDLAAKTVGAEGADGELGRVLNRAVQGDEDAMRAVTNAGHGDVVAQVRAWQRNYMKAANDLVGDPDFIKDAGLDYAPRYRTQEAIDFMEARNASRGFDGDQSFLHRAARAGDDFGEYTLGEGEAAAKWVPDGMDPTSRAAIERQMEGAMREWGFEGEHLFEQDLFTNLERYTRGVTRALEERLSVKRLKELGAGGTLGVNLDDVADGMGAHVSKVTKRISKFEDKVVPQRQAKLKELQAKLDDVSRRAATAEDVVSPTNPQARELDRLRRDAAGAWVHDESPGLQRVLNERVAAASDELATEVRQARKDLKSLLPQKDRLSGSVADRSEKLLDRSPKVAQAYEDVRWAQPKFNTMREAREIAESDPEALIGRLGDDLAAAEQAGASEFELMMRRQSVDTAQAMSQTTDPHIRQLQAMSIAADNLEARLHTGVIEDVGFDQFVREMRSPHGSETFSRVLSDGFADMAKWGHPDVEISQWQLDAIRRTAEVQRNPNKAVRALDKFNRWFKTYAIMTPGFHSRNSMGAWFNNYLAGVDHSTYPKMGAALRQYHKGGGRVGDVQAGLRAIKDPDFREFMTHLQRDGGVLWESTNISSELGRHSIHAKSAPKGWTPKAMQRRGMGQLVGAVDHPIARQSTRVGNHTEHFFRTALAFDHWRKVAPDVSDAAQVRRTISEGVENVYQMHFNYGDLSDVEETWMKRIIPFWTWTSRNMPLQMEMIFRQPKAYQRFGAAMRNISTDDDSDMVPSWMRDSASAAHLGGGQYLTLDMPFSDVDDITRGIAHGDLRAALQSATPALKMPLEVAFGEQAWNAIPITDRQVEMPRRWQLFGLPQALSALLPESEFGRSKEDGKWYMSDRSAYIVEQLWPAMGRVRRLAPSEQRFRDRHLSSFLSFMGVGHRTATDNDKANTAYQRLERLQQIERRQQGRYGRQGYRPEDEREDEDDE